MKTRIYVGYKREGGKEVFRSENEPTEADFPSYFAVWGAFRTMRGARFAASSATNGNPHTQMVSDCERIAKQLAIGK